MPMPVFTAARVSPEARFSVMMHLTEDEARALRAVFIYGGDDLLKLMYERMGRSYLEPYEKAFFSLADAINQYLPPQLSRIDEARKALNALQPVSPIKEG